MGTWSSTKPSLPSGASWEYVAQDVRYNANNFSYTYTVRIARLTNNNVCIRVDCVKNWWDPDRPPNYQRFGVGSDYTYPAGSAGAARYWTGELNYNVGVVVSVGGSSTNTSPAGTTYKSWTAKGPAYVSKYSVSYNSNGGSGTMTDSTFTYGGSTTIANNYFTAPAGYYFNGWQDGNGNWWSAGATYSSAANMTLYAQWAIYTYTLTYKANGGSGSDQTQTKNYGATAYTKAANTFTRTNYTFQYWNTAEDGSGTRYNAGASYTTNANVTLYAIWKKNNIPVYVNTGGSTPIHQVEKAYVCIGETVKECTVYYAHNGQIYTIT